MEDKLRLTKVLLERAVCALLNELEAKAVHRTHGEHDVEVSFPDGFRRSIRDNFVSLQSSKRFVVEVKSHESRSVKIEDVRQLHDWVLRETRRLLPLEEQERQLLNLQWAFNRLRQEFDSLKGARREAEAREKFLKDIDWNLSELQASLESAVYSLTFLVKGLLVINNHYNLAPEERPVAITSFALQYAVDHGIAVLSWPDLLRWHQRITIGETDPLDFWCPLFETAGYFTIVDYDWRRRTDFYYNIFNAGEVILSPGTGPRFLHPEPEVQFGHT